MATTSNEISESIASTLISDLVLYIASFLALSDMLLLGTVSTHYEKIIDRLYLNEDFWRIQAESMYSASQLKHITNYSQLFKDKRRGQAKITPSFFNEKFNYADSNSSLTSFFSTPDDVYYQLGEPVFPISFKRFGVKKIKRVIMNDQAEILLDMISDRLNRLIMYFYLDDFSPEQFHQTISQLSDVYSTYITAEEINFIYLLPIIMDSKALNCFDLLVRAYFPLFLVYLNEQGANPQSQKQYGIHVVLDMVVKAQDELFLNRFLELSILMFPQEATISCFVIAEYLKEENYEKYVTEAFLLASDIKRTAILARFQHINPIGKELAFLNEVIKSETSTLTLTP
ncbi:hypothetical protein [Legionella maioricensis]|uniref:F-box domain-containing protein n=1 Tax=Legionella maioricensis TaxID=2896528 RepID=A0A9X2D105_9GAMM|nr:hypothetical protein [Legionella maioricensis]MCL9683877.1 hypothetical protein [Legionella maioricensis]MCL9686724.1 hypothetical protein [Legionella maioricensis]